MDVLRDKPKDIIKEVTILRQVSHKNIVSIMGFSLQQYEFYIIMEFIDGYTLKDLIFKASVKRQFPLSEGDKTKITYHILLGLAFLHEFPKTIVHRDIKPANITIKKQDC